MSHVIRGKDIVVSFGGEAHKVGDLPIFDEFPSSTIVFSDYSFEMTIEASPEELEVMDDAFGYIHRTASFVWDALMALELIRVEVALLEVSERALCRLTEEAIVSRSDTFSIPMSVLNDEDKFADVFDGMLAEAKRQVGCDDGSE